jgi:hypothetical protein
MLQDLTPNIPVIHKTGTGKSTRSPQATMLCTKLYNKINKEMDVIKSQENINTVYNWSVDNDLGYYLKKCNFSVPTTTKSTQESVYTINGKKLERV